MRLRSVGEWGVGYVQSTAVGADEEMHDYCGPPY